MVIDSSLLFYRLNGPLDSTIYALLSITLQLPFSSDNLMRSKLEKCPNLMAFLKRNIP